MAIVDFSNNPLVYQKTDIKRVLLEKYKLSYVNSIPIEMIENMSIEMVKDHLTQNALVYFETYLASTKEVKKETIEKEPTYEYTTYEYPATWWQHFKHRYFPGWLLDRFPVVTEPNSFKCTCYNLVTENYTTIKLCPHIKMNSNKDCVEFLSTGSLYKS